MMYLPGGFPEIFHAVEYARQEGLMNDRKNPVCCPPSSPAHANNGFSSGYPLSSIPQCLLSYIIKFYGHSLVVGTVCI